MNTAPKLATWLLTRLCSARHAESLIGDLHEQVAAGRNRWWYWRQVVIALALSAAQVVRENGLSFIGALAAGWLAMLAWFATNMWMTGSHVTAVNFVDDTLGVPSRHYSWMTIWFFTAALRLVCFALAGWLAVRIYRRHSYAVAIALIASAWLWKWVPWRMYRAFDDEILMLVHDVTGLGGLLLGAAWGIYQAKRRASRETRRSV